MYLEFDYVVENILFYSYDYLKAKIAIIKNNIARQLGLL